MSEKTPSPSPAELPEKTGSFTAEQIEEIPRAPGVYQMFDARGKVIYVGKAVNLRARVRQYFALSGGDNRPTVPYIRKDLHHIETIVTANEKEAFLLENTLIKRHKPRYNILLRDDKTFVSVRLDPREEWPRAQLVRRRPKDGALYFGPYTSSRAIRQTLKMLQRVFPLRSCSDSVLHNRSRPCMLHQIGRCCAPCVGKVSAEAYGEMVEGTAQFLKGKSGELLSKLREEMATASEAMEFEKAALLRDRIAAIESSSVAQQVISGTGEDRDALGLAQGNGLAILAILIFRNGQLIQSLSWNLPHFGESVAATLYSFLGQFYDASRVPPSEVLTPEMPEEAELLREVLEELRGGRVQLHRPQRGNKRRLVEMAQRNAKEALERKQSGREQAEKWLKDLQYRLKLPELPRRIECYDIATLQGSQSAGSRVVFEEGEPRKSDYRLYKIKWVDGVDDFAMMREVLTRRFRRAADEPEKWPDLVLLDGGKGQLNIVAEGLKEMGINAPLAALVKEHLKQDEEGDSYRTAEELYLPGRKNPVVFPPRAASFFLLQRIRDEAHRFVNQYHGKSRRKSHLRGALLDIPGIGPARARALLRHFGSLTRVKEASREDLAAAPTMNDSTAEAVWQAFHKEQQEEPLAE